MELARPSAVAGWARALRLWKLVAVVWLMPVVLVSPVLLIVYGALAPAFSRLPPGGPADGGEIMLIAVDALDELLRPLVLSVAAAVLLHWLWTVLWHASVAMGQLWGGGGRMRLAELLGLGLVGWWRYLRLSLTAVAVLSAGMVGVCLAGAAPLSRAFHGGRGFLPVVVLIAAVSAALVLLLAVWAATLRGAWLLAEPGRRSALGAFAQGLFAAARAPLATLTLLAAWALPAILLSLLPLILGWQLEAMRGSYLGVLLSVGAGLARAFCLVALFCSFAPRPAD